MERIEINLEEELDKCETAISSIAEFKEKIKKDNEMAKELFKGQVPEQVKRAQEETKAQIEDSEKQWKIQRQLINDLVIAQKKLQKLDLMSGLWVTDKPDAIPEDKKDVFWKLTPKDFE